MKKMSPKKSKKINPKQHDRKKKVFQHKMDDKRDHLKLMGII